MDDRDHSFGKHYLVEFSGCPAEKVSCIADIREPFLEAARLSGATILESFFHQFEPRGVTGMIFIAESHFSLHTWPEAGYVAFDILTCGVMFPERAIEHLKQSFQAAHVDIRVFTRGFNDQ
ncbi:MAG: adenosylmethionine decarboxylase [Candidatus Omnitrophica bacterium]|nr:adenosylmethionine decarboxylase [Candidatus Omnitrophota bacterium]